MFRLAVLMVAVLPLVVVGSAVSEPRPGDGDASADGERAAMQLLGALRGSWRFYLSPVSGQGGVEGSRAFLASPNPLALEWRERIDGGDLEIVGYLGYDAERERFYEFALASKGGGEFALGYWAAAERRSETSRAIEFIHDGKRDGSQRITTLRMLDERRFEYVREVTADGVRSVRWRARFVRE